MNQVSSCSPGKKESTEELVQIIVSQIQILKKCKYIIKNMAFVNNITNAVKFKVSFSLISEVHHT